MASDVTVPVTVQAPAAAPPGLIPHFRRFLAVYALLGAALWGAAVIGVIYGTRSLTPGASWSTWHPPGGGLGQSEQIASHVGSEYRLGNGNPLVTVIAKPPVFTANSIPVGYALYQGGKLGSRSYTATSRTSTVLYDLCGLGPGARFRPARNQLSATCSCDARSCSSRCTPSTTTVPSRTSWRCCRRSRPSWRR